MFETYNKAIRINLLLNVGQLNLFAAELVFLVFEISLIRIPGQIHVGAPNDGQQKAVQTKPLENWVNSIIMRKYIMFS